MSALYPPSSAAVPPDLTAPSPAYTRHARLALAALLAFVFSYLALLGWFAWTSYRLLSLYGQTNHIAALVWGIANAFFAVFLAKALIFVKRSKPQRSSSSSSTAGSTAGAEHPRPARAGLRGSPAATPRGAWRGR